MEPFRPIVDRAVVGLCAEMGVEAPMEKETRARLLEPLTGRFLVEGENRTLFDIAARAAQSLAAVYAGKGKTLVLPEV